MRHGLAHLAVVPVLSGPFHTVLLVLPIILLALLLASPWLNGSRAWRTRGIDFTHTFRRRPLRNALLSLVTLTAITLCAAWLISAPPAPPPPTLPSSSDPWPTFHRNPSRTGSDDTPLPAAPSLLWKFRDPQILERRPFASSPAVCGQRAVIGSDNYNTYCIDITTGQELWRFAASNPIFSSPAIHAGRVYIGEGLHFTTNAKLYCLDLADGKLLWSHQTSSHVESSPAVHNGHVYVGAGDDGLLCLDAATGTLKWQHKGPHVDCGPLVVDRRVCFGAGYGSNGVSCISATDGHPIWKRDLPHAVWGAVSSSADRLYIAIGNGTFEESDDKPFGEVRCLSASDGSDLWRFTNAKDGILTSIVIAGQTALFGSRDGALYALDATTGKLLWRTDIGSPILSTPAVAAGQVIFGADDGKLRSLNLADGRELWSFDTDPDTLMIMAGSRIQSSPAAAQGKLVFGGSNGHVYCLGQSQDAIAAPTSPFRSRLMRSANWLITSLLKSLIYITTSTGGSLLILGCAVGLLMFLLRRPRNQSLITSLMLCLGYVTLPLIALFVIDCSPHLTSARFLWIADLSAPDRLALIPGLPLLGPDLNVLPLALAFVVFLHTAFANRGPAARTFFAFAVLLLAFFAYRWPAGVLLYLISLFAWPARPPQLQTSTHSAFRDNSDTGNSRRTT